MTRAGKRALPLLLLTILFLLPGCSDRLAPPTGNDAAAERSIAFSWFPENDPKGELIKSATITSRGRDRAALEVDGIILSVKNGMMAVVRLDTARGNDTLLYGSVDGTTHPLQIIASESTDIIYDFGSVTLSDDGTKLACYSGEYYRTLLNVYDAVGAGSFTLDQIDLNLALQEPMLPPPAFSPSGDSLAYIGYDQISQQYTLAVTSLSAPSEEIVAFNPLVVGSSTLVDWSPDGNRILFAGYDYSGSSGALGIYTIDRNGTGFDAPEIMVLASDFGTPQTPAWAPDGKSFAYSVVSAFGQATIITVNTETNAAATLVTTRGGTLDLAWSRDGSQILYTDGKEALPTPGVSILPGILYTFDLASKRAIPIATNVVKGFWVE